MSTDGRLTGKRTMVTGAGTGIGREVALEFARQGSDVVLHYAVDPGAVTAAEEIKAMGRRAAALQADFDSVDEVCALAEKALEFLGGIDCLVNNAGITFNKPFLKVTREQFDRVFHVNFRAQFFLTQRIVEAMLRAGGGAICNLTSIHGLQGAPEHSLYAGTKGAIIAYTRSLAVELAHQGIRVNAIAPGWIETEMTAPVHSMPLHDEIILRTPAGRFGEPEEIAGTAVYLASRASDFVTGDTIRVDGGFAIR